MRVLVTGAAGFIGSFTCHKLLDRGDQVVGLDNLNDYYAVSLKEDRLNRLQARADFTFERADIGDSTSMATLFREHEPNRVVHLAAQAGVRYSLENPPERPERGSDSLIGVLILRSLQRAARIRAAVSPEW